MSNETMMSNESLMDRLVKAEVEKALAMQQLSAKATEDKSELYEALAKAQANFSTVKKSGKATVPTKNGSSFTYNYAKLGDILAATKPALNREGLFFSQHSILGEESGMKTVAIVSTIRHKSGAILETTSVPLAYQLTEPQKLGSVMTYLRRYSACQLLGLEGEDDDDANLVTHAGINYQASENVQRQAQQPQKKQMQPRQQVKPAPQQGNGAVSKVEPQARVDSNVTSVCPQPSAATSDSSSVKPVQKQMEKVKEEVKQNMQEETVPSASPEKKTTEPANQAQKAQKSPEAVYQSALQFVKARGASEEQVSSWEKLAEKNVQLAIEEMRRFCGY